MRLIDNLARLGSFNHHACDALLVKYQIHVDVFKLTDPSADFDIWSGFLVIAFVEAMTIFGIIGASKRRWIGSKDHIEHVRGRRPVLWLIVAGGFVVLWAYLNQISDYVTTCTQLLTAP